MQTYLVWSNPLTLWLNNSLCALYLTYLLKVMINHHIRKNEQTWQIFRKYCRVQAKSQVKLLYELEEHDKPLFSNLIGGYKCQIDSISIQDTCNLKAHQCLCQKMCELIHWSSPLPMTILQSTSIFKSQKWNIISQSILDGHSRRGKLSIHNKMKEIWVV